MVIDSSAIIAFLRSEPEAVEIEALLDRTADLRMSAFSVFESRVVLYVRFGPQGSAGLVLLLAKAGVLVEPFDVESLLHCIAITSE